MLVVDIGGTHVKVRATGQQVPREFPSGPTLTAEQMVDGGDNSNAFVGGFRLWERARVKRHASRAVR